MCVCVWGGEGVEGVTLVPRLGIYNLWPQFPLLWVWKVAALSQWVEAEVPLG